MTKSEMRNRAESVLNNNTNLFKTKPETYQQQFSGIYRKRLQTLWPVLAKAAGTKWISSNNKLSIIDKISNVIEYQDSVIIGTVFLDQKNKPSILEELSKSQWEDDKPLPKNYCSDSQLYFLEDESGRIQISLGDLSNKYVIVTGMIIAVLGAVGDDGIFIATDISYSGLSVQRKKFEFKQETFEKDNNSGFDLSSDKTSENKLVAIVSGLEINNRSSEFEFKRQLLADFICGQLGSSSVPSTRISNLIIAGNSINSFPQDLGPQNQEESDDFDHIYEKMVLLGLEKTNDAKFQETLTESKSEFEILDEYLSQLTNCLDVILMPGESDPTSSILPQQQISVDIMLPKTHSMNSLHSTTNPAMFDIDNVSFLGSSGQNVQDISRCLVDHNLIDIAYSTLSSRLFAPTSPDTIPCYPSQTHDPLILTECPNVYFIGNMPYFDSRVVVSEDGEKSVLIVLVPKFSTTGELVLFDLQSKSVQLVQF
ncbi:DNA polymerase delta small subunit [Smittium culicis]|uniref:DNA polymerase delta small subunit n=1 Tax=Smittium culicis TaxID=133412 RepID=A0A1R1YAX2_9FUNG|nr:DNA polymerase delta small subunit [Smittium culicis]